MPFHRLTVPTYFGGLPVGYDYLNTPSDPSVGGTGVPAIVDAIKSGGPNDGTYFVAFGEDGRSGFANRPAAALGANTDFLDDILRTSIPIVSFADATAVGAVATVALVGQIWVGESGLANNQTNRDKIIRVTDQNNNDLEVGGTKITALLIHDGAAANVVGTEASGFRTNASVNFTPSIPTTTTYRVWFGTRDNVANISGVNKGAYFREQLRTINNIPGEVRSLFRQIHSEPSVNQAFDAAFDSTIRSLASSGLNERYRRATTQPAGFVSGDYNVAGGGATILRDGQAVTIKSPDTEIDDGVNPDPQLALLKLIPLINPTAFTNFTNNHGADIGIWHETEFKNFATVNEVVRASVQGPALVDATPRSIRAATISGNAVYTFINETADATANPASDPTTGRQIIECAAGQHFALSGPTRTAIRTGIDYLEVTWPGGSPKPEMYVIMVIFGPTQVLVRHMGGTNADFGAVAVPGLRIRLIQPNVRIGAGSQHLYNQTQFITRPLLVIPPAILTAAPGSEVTGLCAFFASASPEAGNIQRTRAFEWGRHNLDGTVLPTGALTGEGGVYGTVGSFTGNFDIGGDLTVDDITADDVIVDTLAVNRPEHFSGFREDFIRFVQEFTPDIIHADGLWAFTETAGTFTLNNATPTAKNPGQLAIIGAGGSSSKDLAIYKTSQFPWAFANIEEVTIVIKVVDDVANAASGILIGLRDDFDAANGGADALQLSYSAAFGDWRLSHRRAGVNGANNGTVLGAYVSGEFVVVKFRKNAANDIDVFFNDTLEDTVAFADLPTGNCTFGLVCGQTVADAGVSTFTVDLCSLRATTAAARSGA